LKDADKPKVDNIFVDTNKVKLLPVPKYVNTYYIMGGDEIYFRFNISDLIKS
jgi:hypothetical protein